MSRFFFLLAGLFVSLSLAAQAQAQNRRVGPSDDTPATGETRAKDEKSTPVGGNGVVAKKEAEDKQSAPTKNSPAAAATTTAAAAGVEKISPGEAEPGKRTPANTTANSESSASSVVASPKIDPPAEAGHDAPAAASASLSAAAPPTTVYRVGVGDVLDVRLLNGLSRDSTLYTVSAGGFLDYPPAGDPLNVAGMTTDEIGDRLAAELKRRALNERAQFRVSVREYVSHMATISGLVDQPGAKILRREAVPLYVVLAEALPRADAGRAIIISRANGSSKAVDLADPQALNELVVSGDVINVSARQPEYYYIGGQINAPGQKDFHAGMTLTQALLASGGVRQDAGGKVKITISRQGADGRLASIEFLLKEIETGEAPDPRIQPGDRVEVGRRR